MLLPIKQILFFKNNSKKNMSMAHYFCNFEKVCALLIKVIIFYLPISIIQVQISGF